MAIGKVTKGKKTKTYINDNVSGTFVIDWSDNITAYKLTAIGDVIFTEKNLPPANVYRHKRIYLEGDFAFELMDKWGDNYISSEKYDQKGLINLELLDSSTDTYVYSLTSAYTEAVFGGGGQKQ
jgi:hypothetical protein